MGKGGRRINGRKKIDQRTENRLKMRREKREVQRMKDEMRIKIKEGKMTPETLMFK